MKINSTNNYTEKIDFFFQNEFINQNSELEDFKSFDGLKSFEIDSKFNNSSLYFINPTKKMIWIQIII